MSFSLNNLGFNLPQFKKVFDSSSHTSSDDEDHRHPSNTHQLPHPHHLHPWSRNYEKPQLSPQSVPGKGYIYDPDAFEDSGICTETDELEPYDIHSGSHYHKDDLLSSIYDDFSDDEYSFEDSSLLDDTFIFPDAYTMAAPVRTLADIPTITQLYAKSALRPSTTTAPAFPVSRSLNDRVGVTHGDITKVALDAVVNAANSTLLGGGGVDGAIHRAAGPDLLAECEELNGCRTGHAKITGGHRLPAKHVIHTVGPVYNVLDPKQSARMLRSCYEESLKLAAREGLSTVAFSGISTGVYGYPSRDAAEIACEVVRRMLVREASSLSRVVFVTFDEKDAAAYREMIP